MGKSKKEKRQAYFFDNKALLALILPLVVEQLLAVLVGMADSIMIASVGEAAVEQHRFCIGRSGQVDVSDQFFIRLLILCLQHFQRHMFPVLL